MESILDSVKHALGLPPDPSYNYYDADIIMHINTVLNTLTQLGVGDNAGFQISDNTAVWNDFLGSNAVLLNTVKSYVSMKVRMIFDPPQSSNVYNALENMIRECEWRIYAQVDKQE